MDFYRDRLLPHLIAFAMRNANLVPYRQRVVSPARGRVLEIGIGAGANLPFYSAHVREIIGLEPSPRLSAMTRKFARDASLPVSLIEAAAETIPLDDACVDAVVMTWTLCSVPDAERSLAEMRRVLRPGGSLHFVEHGLAKDQRTRRWQQRLTPVWRRLAGGCHLNRAIDALIANAGFKMERLETGYMPGPRPMTFMYAGNAARA